MTRNHRTRVLAAVGLTAALGGTSACGSSDSSSGITTPAATGSGQMTTLNVAVVPALPAAGLYLGVEKGIFKKHGLDVKTQAAQSGAAEVALALNGQIQAGFISTVVLSLSVGRGVPVEMVAPADVVHSPSYGGIITKDAAIKKASDLAGRTVAVNALGGVDELMIREAVRNDGGAPSNVKFVEVPYPQMQTAVEAKRVDVAIATTPFLESAVKAGAINPFPVPTGVGGEGALVSGYFMTKEYAKANPGIIKQFSDAMLETNAYAEEHPDEIRAVIPSYTEMPGDVLANIALPKFATTAVSAASVDPVLKVMSDFGYLKKPLTAADVLGG